MKRSLLVSNLDNLYNAGTGSHEDSPSKLQACLQVRCTCSPSRIHILPSALPLQAPSPSRPIPAPYSRALPGCQAQCPELGPQSGATMSWRGPRSSVTDLSHIFSLSRLAHVTSHTWHSFFSPLLTPYTGSSYLTSHALHRFLSPHCSRLTQVCHHR